MPGEKPLSPLEQQILKARMKVGQEMSDVADVPVEPMGFLDRMVAGLKERTVGGGRVVATANPRFRPTDSVGMPIQGAKVGRVRYNPEVLQELGDSGIKDTLAHELVHVRQGREGQSGGLLSQVRDFIASIGQGTQDYGQQPDELEAYQYEGDRAVREGRTPPAVPKFQLSDEDRAAGRILRERGDINLLSEEQQEMMRKLRAR